MSPRVFRILAVLLLTVAVVAVIVQTGGERMRQQVAQCRAHYDSARTLAETLKVDSMLLSNPGSRFQLWHTCGRLMRRS